MGSSNENPSRKAVKETKDPTVDNRHPEDSVLYTSAEIVLCEEITRLNNITFMYRRQYVYLSICTNNQQGKPEPVDILS